MQTAVQSAPTVIFPAINARLLVTAVVAGAFATIAFDLFGQTISPLLKAVASPWLGAKLAPVPLANSVLAVLSGWEAREIGRLGIGHGLHVLTGLIFYPLGYMLVARPVTRLFATVPWWLIGLAYGVVLWVIALYVMAHLIAGNPPFLGWSSITWVALWGHMLFGLVVAAVVWWRHERA